MTSILPFEPGMALGMGFKSLDHSQCLLNAVSVETNKVAVDPTQRVEFKCYSSTSQSDLATALDVSASLAINKGQLNLSAAGQLLKKEITSEADLNFVVKVTVKNAYKASEKVPTFNWIKQKDKSDFYEVYGDTYISNILEGGEFMGIVSFKAHSSSEVMNIKAKLEGGFSGIQAKGAGAYDTSELQKMANTDVNVIYSGAGGVNSKGEKWTMKLMFNQASKFPELVAQGKEPVAVIIKSYTSLPSFIRLENYKQYLMPQNAAQDEVKVMLDHLAEFEKLDTLLKKAINDVNAGRTTLKDPKGVNAYQSNVTGLQKAIEDVATAVKIIRDNAKVLQQLPSATTETKPGLQNYNPPFKISSNLPVITSLSSPTARPAVGSGLSACAFTSDQKPQAYAFWQCSTPAVYTSAFVNSTWSLGLNTVVDSARTNTPIAACCSNDGKEVSVFHFTPQGDLNQRRLTNNNWSNGNFFERMKAVPAEKQPHILTRIAAFYGSKGSLWVFYQTETWQILAATYAADINQWKFEIITPQSGEIKPYQGSSLTTASVALKDDHGDETFLIAWHGQDAKIYELRYNSSSSTWGTPTVVMSRRLSLATGLCAFNGGENNVTIVVSSEENRLLTLSWTKEKPNWSEEKSIGNGIRGGDIAVASWRNGSARALMQTEDSMDLNDFVLDAGNWALAGTANKT